MTRKVILDCDPGIDDAVALAMALFDPRLEVVAVTATAGNVSADQASRNVQAIIEQLDPFRFPRVGCATAPEDCAGTNALHMHGEDGLGNTGFAVSRLHHRHPSEKVICDAVRAEPNRVTLVCLGPLTQSGCGAICPSYNRGCYGCFGPAAQANCQSLSSQYLRRGTSRVQLVPWLRNFNADAPAFREEGDRIDPDYDRGNLK